MALRGIKVLEMAGLAPVPFCGMLLADLGATVTKVERLEVAGLDVLRAGKRSVIVNLKDQRGTEIVQKLCSQSDVLIDSFRPGVMEKLGLGPEEMTNLNPRLIYARLTGFGQTGPFSKMAGHDINYIGLSGLLSLLGRPKEPPSPPINVVADFGGGGLSCAFGILVALLERTKSGKGQIIDASMVEGTAYLGSWITRTQNMSFWGNERGCNILDGGVAYYNTYETSDGKYMAVGALEPQFYSSLILKLGLDEDKCPQHMDATEQKKIFSDIFRKRTQDEWCEIFDGSDACVTPVLSLTQAPEHKHNKARNSFLSQKADASHITIPNPAPILSRTPAVSSAAKPESQPGEDTAAVLAELGYSGKEIAELAALNVITLPETKAHL